jgi:hypothetical protein
MGIGLGIGLGLGLGIGLGLGKSARRIFSRRYSFEGVR